MFYLKAASGAFKTLGAAFYSLYHASKLCNDFRD
jgi:hypothetical protein